MKIFHPGNAGWQFRKSPRGMPVKTRISNPDARLLVAHMAPSLCPIKKSVSAVRAKKNSFLQTMLGMLLCVNGSILLTGCNHVPSQNILGAYFPSWMLCVLLGILATLLIRYGAIKASINTYIPVAGLVYLGLALSLSFFFWLVWYGN